MKLKEKVKKTCRVRNLIRFCLISLFLWWGINAVVKYWRQPLSTDVRYRQEEAKPGNQFPLITLCNSRDFFGNPIIKDCVDGLSWDFIGTVVCCMKHNNTSKEANFIQNLPLEKGDIVEMVRFWTGSKYLQQLDGKAWTTVFLEKSGPCYTFDLSKVDKLKHISLENGKRPAIEFVMAENLQRAVLMLHTRFDLPDAFLLNEFLPLSFLDKTKQAHRVSFRKKKSKRESTRRAPCVKYEYNTCQSIENNLLVFKRFHCRIPFLNDGQHLQDVIPKIASNCSNQVTVEALDLLSKKESTNCILSQTCENTTFTSNHKVDETWFENKTLVFVASRNPEVEYHHSYISYDLISLIGEIGGILGITLGASALTFFESLLRRFPYY